MLSHVFRRTAAGFCLLIVTSCHQGTPRDAESASVAIPHGSREADVDADVLPEAPVEETLVESDRESPAADTLDVEGARFPRELQLGDRRLTLRGAGSFTYKLVFTLYAAALYTESDTADVHGDTPRQLVLHYFYDIPKSAFADEAARVLDAQLIREEVRRLKPRIDALHRLYTDVEEGDRYTLTYIPGKGTELALNQRRLGVIPGPDFAKAYFGIWLRDRGSDEPLRKALLGL